MSEPIYSYVKGQGWVVHPGILATMKCGTLVRLEPRKPRSHEPWMYAESWFEDGVPDIVQFKNCIELDFSGYEGFVGMRNPTLHKLRMIEMSDPIGYVTVVKL